MEMASSSDPQLMEMIVRALTSRDRPAMVMLEEACTRDPELKAFCDDLNDVVNVLVGSKDWRKEAPSAALREKIRAAVQAKLPAAPQSFRLVFTESDLGRRKASHTIIFVSIAAIILLAVVSWFGSKWTGSDRTGKLELSGQRVYENALKTGGVQDWDTSLSSGGAWEIRDGGFEAPVSSGETTSTPATAFLKTGYDSKHALAFTIESKVPDLDDGTGLMVFLTEGESDAPPALGPGERPERGIALEINREGILIQGTGHTLLYSRPFEGPAARFFQIRMEHLGENVRVLINGEVRYDGPMPQRFRGSLYPGLRVSGPKKSEITFNAARVER